MSTKKDDGGGAMALIAIIALALALILLPCMIYGFFHRSAVLKRLQISQNARQVFDAGNIWNTVKGYYAECIGMVFLLGIGLFGLNLLLGAVGIEPANTAGHVVDIIYLAICALILMGMALAAGMATGTASVGVWVDPATDQRAATALHWLDAAGCHLLVEGRARQRTIMAKSLNGQKYFGLGGGRNA